MHGLFFITPRICILNVLYWNWIEVLELRFSIISQVFDRCQKKHIPTEDYIYFGIYGHLWTHRTLSGFRKHMDTVGFFRPTQFFFHSLTPLRRSGRVWHDCMFMIKIWFIVRCISTDNHKCFVYVSAYNVSEQYQSYAKILSKTQYFGRVLYNIGIHRVYNIKFHSHNSVRKVIQIIC